MAQEETFGSGHYGQRKRPLSMKKLLVAFVLSLLVVHCGQAGHRISRQDKSGEQDYLIGPEDVLEIQVWKNADLSRVVNVRPDGKCSLPLIGDVQAAGLSTVQLTEQITEKLLAYYQERPQVVIIVQQVNSNVFYILGEVRNPGRYIMKGGATILQGITLAGGFTDFASRNKISLIRRENGRNNKESRIKVSYKDIVSGKQDNILLNPGDTIIVP